MEVNLILFTPDHSRFKGHIMWLETDQEDACDAPFVSTLMWEQQNEQIQGS